MKWKRQVYYQRKKRFIFIPAIHITSIKKKMFVDDEHHYVTQSNKWMMRLRLWWILSISPTHTHSKVKSNIKAKVWCPLEVLKQKQKTAKIKRYLEFLFSDFTDGFSCRWKMKWNEMDGWMYSSTTTIIIIIIFRVWKLSRKIQIFKTTSNDGWWSSFWFWHVSL